MRVSLREYGNMAVTLAIKSLGRWNLVRLVVEIMILRPSMMMNPIFCFLCDDLH